MPGDVRVRPPEHEDGISDRVVAVVNNDAITLGELQESIVAYRAENRQGRGAGLSDDELAKQFLPKLINNRLQLQEADREKITVEDQEVSEELLERIKIYNTKSLEEFEKLVQEQGITMEAIKKRVREGLRVQKVVRRKVALRVSVTDTEIVQYVEENRQKLETGLSYHARHILVVPDGDNDAAWEGARIKADILRAQILAGGEDLAHTGAHKINNALGQGLLAKRMGKRRIIAETGAGQHGVATATVCAMLGLECIVYMGEDDIQRRSSNLVETLQKAQNHNVMRP